MSRRKILALLLAATCLPALTMLGLGWRLLEHDRGAEVQYRRERREQVADRVVRSLQAALTDPRLFLEPPGEGAILIHYPKGGALFRGTSELLPESSEVFEQGEALENRRGDWKGAAGHFRALTASSDANVRTGAWVRLARVLRKSKAHQEALRAYEELAAYGTRAAAGWPAALAAAWGRCAVLGDMHREKELVGCAASLRQRLDAGEWALSFGDYEVFADDCKRWTGVQRPRQREMLTQAANDLWARIQDGHEAAQGRRLAGVGGETVTLLWQAIPNGGVAVMAASQSFTEQAWLRPYGDSVWLRGEAGKFFPSDPRGDVVLRHPSETGLPLGGGGGRRQRPR